MKVMAAARNGSMKRLMYHLAVRMGESGGHLSDASGGYQTAYSASTLPINTACQHPAYQHWPNRGAGHGICARRAASREIARRESGNPDEAYYTAHLPSLTVSIGHF